MVKGNTIFIATHPKRDCCFRGLMLRKVMPMQQLFQVNVKVRGRQTCVKILKLGDSSLDGGAVIEFSFPTTGNKQHTTTATGKPQEI